MAKVVVKDKPKNSKGYGLYLLVLMVSFGLIFLGNKVASGGMVAFDNASGMDAQEAKITEISDVVETENQSEESTDFTVKDILFKAQITSGEKTGESVDAIQSINSYFILKPQEVAVGDKVILYEFKDEYYGTDWVFGEFIRVQPLLVLGVVFALLLILFGRAKGLQTLVSLVFTIAAVFYVFVPAILSGYNIYLWTMIVGTYIIFMTLLIVSGISIKTAVASIGCLSGMLFSAAMFFVMDYFLKLTGVIDQDSVFLLMMNPERPIDLKGVIFGAIVIGAIGAIMDVAMSISSALYEMKEKYAANSFAQLVSSGLTIGRDIMGTMANTLVLAYIGSSLSVVLLMITYNPSLLDLLNREMVIVEILQALIGSLSILMTLPLTAVVAGTLYSRAVDKNRLRNRI